MPACTTPRPLPSAASARPLLARRRGLCLLAGAALGPWLAAPRVARAGLGYTVPQAQLQSWLAQRFPVTRKLAGGLATLSLQSPRLSLLPASNRIATVLDMALAEALSGASVSGGMDLDYALQFDMADGAVRMQDVRVNRLTIDQLPPAQQALLSQYAPAIAGELLSGMALHHVAPNHLAMARSLGVGSVRLQVQPGGLRIELGGG